MTFVLMPEQSRGCSEKTIEKLGLLAGSGGIVPKYFSVTSVGFDEFLDKSGVRGEVLEIAKNCGDSSEELKKAADNAMVVVMNGEMKSHIKDGIAKAYKNIGLSKEALSFDFLRAVKDPVTVSITGVSDGNKFWNFLNVRGEESLANNVITSWSRVFNADVIKKIKDSGEFPKPFLLVQKMVKPEKSGTVTPQGDSISIESCWGLLDAESPSDTHVLDYLGNVSEKRVGVKSSMLTVDKYTNRIARVGIDDNRRNDDILDKSELGMIMSIHKSMVDRFGESQGFEWASERGRIKILNLRSDQTGVAQPVKEEPIAPLEMVAPSKQVQSPEHRAFDTPSKITPQSPLHSTKPQASNEPRRVEPPKPLQLPEHQMSNDSSEHDTGSILATDLNHVGKFNGTGFLNATTADEFSKKLGESGRGSAGIMVDGSASAVMIGDLLNAGAESVHLDLGKLNGSVCGRQELHSATKKLVTHIVRLCHKRDVPISAKCDVSENVEFLIRMGIGDIYTYDMGSARRHAQVAEKKLLTEFVRKRLIGKTF